MRTQEEQQEGFVVAVADAVVDPGAMVAHAQHTPLAQAAVVAAGRLVPVALLAESHHAALRATGGKALVGAGTQISRHARALRKVQALAKQA